MYRFGGWPTLQTMEASAGVGASEKTPGTLDFDPFPALQ